MAMDHLFGLFKKYKYQANNLCGLTFGAIKLDHNAFSTAVSTSVHLRVAPNVSQSSKTSMNMFTALYSLVKRMQYISVQSFILFENNSLLMLLREKKPHGMEEAKLS